MRANGHLFLGVYLAGESTSAIDMVWYRDPGFAPGMAPLYCCCLFIIPVCKSGSSGSRDKAVTNLQEDWSPNNA